MNEETSPRDAAGEEEASAPDGTPMGGIPLANAIGARNLLIIIVTMPLFFLLVVLGTISIFGKPSEKAPKEAAAVAALSGGEEARLDQPKMSGAVAATPVSALAADPASISLPAGAAVASMSLDGDRLALNIKTKAGGEIVIYDLARGAVLQRIKLAEAESGL